MSEPPNPPSRNDPKYRLRPSLEIAGPFSLRTELITGPRLTGVDHPENFGDPATGLDTANKANATPIRTYTFRLLPPCHIVSWSSPLSTMPPRSFCLVRSRVSRIAEQTKDRSSVTDDSMFQRPRHDDRPTSRSPRVTPVPAARSSVGPAFGFELAIDQNPQACLLEG